MGYKTTTTTNRVYLVHLHRLNRQQRELCERLRAEAGRCWTDLVHAHVTNRDHGAWLTEADLKQMSKGGRYRLHRNGDGLVTVFGAAGRASSPHRQRVAHDRGD